MKKLIMFLGVALMLTSFACGTDSSESKPKTESKVYGGDQGKKHTEEQVIQIVKDKLAATTDCGFLLEETDWTTEYNKNRKLWLVTVAFTDSEGSKSYTWNYFVDADSAESPKDGSQTECLLQGQLYG